MTSIDNSQPNSSFWKNRRVLVSGGAGFIGSHLVEVLVHSGARVRIADSFENGSTDNIRRVAHEIDIMKANLLDPSDCIEACADMNMVLNLGAKVAGVAYNSLHSADMFHANVRIGTNMLEASRLTNVDRFLIVSSACVYGRNTSVPTPEAEGFFGDPEPSNLGYGWAKRVLELQGRLYAEQYGMKIAIVRPFNTYGPRDHFDVEFGHVIPSLIRKVIEGQNPLVVWGDGTQTRSFVYVTDVVEGMLMALQRNTSATPINLGSSEEISIGNLARLIKQLSSANITIVFDTKMPSGQPRRCPDVSLAKDELGFQAETMLEDGIRQTIDWYRNSLNSGKQDAIAYSVREA